jgi:hypothetical protein
MARYEQLFSVAVTHEFHAGRAVPDLRYVPAAPTAALMEREGLLLRATADGMEVWREVRPEGWPGQAADARMLLRFEVLSSDPLMRFYTEWPAPALRFSNRYPGADGAGPLLRPARWARRDGLASQLHEPLFRIDIDFRPAAGVAAAPPRWQVALASRRIHWKYFFSGALAARQLNIVDLDASDSAQGISFAPAVPAAVDGGSAYLSALALPIQKSPQQRLQLREVGAAGKVLIRRLPNASVEKMGKQRGPNGQSMIVAEIYIHQ